jgi:DNA-binding transcriptional MerR regulator
VSTAQDRSYKLEELARDAGVSPRTVRYYVQRGLLPPPLFKGRDTVYSTDHLLRLRAIRRLQERFLPLDAIAVEIGRRSVDELRDLADGKGDPTPPPVLKLTAKEEFHPYRAVPESVKDRWTRWIVAEGLEIHLREDAPERSRALAEELRSRCERGGKQR